MIYITGDIHREQDIHKINPREFTVGDTLTENDYVIICVDMFFKMVYYTTTNIQSCEQDMTLSKPGHREYQFW